MRRLPRVATLTAMRPPSLFAIATAVALALAVAIVAASRTPALAATAPAIEADPNADSDAAAPRAVPACVHVSAESRYVPYGYNHLVTLRNGCTRTVTCTVSTNVSPEPQTVEVAAGTAVEVTTFLGSPWQNFVPRVSCRTR